MGISYVVRVACSFALLPTRQYTRQFAIFCAARMKRSVGEKIDFLTYSLYCDERYTIRIIYTVEYDMAHKCQDMITINFMFSYMKRCILSLECILPLETVAVEYHCCGDTVFHRAAAEISYDM